MIDNRPHEVQHFREQQRAQCVHLLTVVSPFSARLDRFILLETDRGATLLSCIGCGLRAALGEGQRQPAPSETLARFRRKIDALDPDWPGDAIPPDAHDGITLILERADAEIYNHLRIAPPLDQNSPQARLLSAWLETFPLVRRTVGAVQ